MATKHDQTRRDFVKTAVTVAGAVSASAIQTVKAAQIASRASGKPGRTEIELSGQGWSLWLDHAAVWADDEAHLPPVTLSSLPVNAPTVGWASLHNGAASDRKVQVPGTVEEYYWGEIGGAIPDTGGDYVGVSWWSRSLTLDPALAGKRIILKFASVNLRAEVFVNGQLVGYDVIGNTPFEADATRAVVFNGPNRLDVRITDPVGDFSWDDNTLMRWGNNLVPAVHGFGGITGPVTLVAADAVRVTDIYVQNQREPRRVQVFVTLENASSDAQSGDLSLAFREKRNPSATVWTQTKAAAIPPGTATFTFSADVPEAKLWELQGYQGKGAEQTALYEAVATFTAGNGRIADSDRQRFGFRIFEVGEKDGDRRFYLNGRRVVIKSAMTRGFWPVNGIFATPEMAQRDRETLEKFGLNMMLLHRAIGQPPVIEYADSAGLFTYEEPGGYRIMPNRRDNIQAPDDKARNWRREKLRRMIVRDRSLPSMIIYNLKNEATNPPDDDDIANMRMVHELDPARIVTYNSDHNRSIEYHVRLEHDPFMLHMLPFDDALHYTDWYDQHHWFGYSGYVDENYNNPKDYLRGSMGAPREPQPEDAGYPLTKSDIIFWGEEGAFGAMVRLQKIKERLDKTGAAGFREMEHLDWFHYYDRFLDQSGFRSAYPDVDSLTMSLGRNLHYYHGRNIENVRLSNVGDGYNMNGWASASTRTDVVDMYRNPTADPAIISHYTQPLYVAVKLRRKVLPEGAAAVADCYIINEADLRGEHVLVLKYTDPTGKSIFEKSYDVKVSGGEEFGELLVEGVELPATQSPGHYMLTASLKQGATEKASGFDDVFAVNINDGPGFSGHLAVIEDDAIVRDFLRKTRNIAADTYRPDLGRLDAIIVGNHKFDALGSKVVGDLMHRVEGGTRVIVLENADKFAEAVNRVLQDRPAIYAGGGIVRWNGSGRLFVGKSRYLEGLPQGEGMSWEYQCFYKTSPRVRSAEVEGIRLDHWGTELVVALGNQGQKEILSALSGVRVGAGDVILSTLMFLPNLATDETSSVVAKKLFLNLLQA